MEQNLSAPPNNELAQTSFGNPEMRRRSWLKLAASATAALGLGSVGSSARAAAFPSKPVRILVGQTAGGTTDAIPRAASQRLAELWGQQLVVENRTGANSFLAMQILKGSEPDGHTLLAVNQGALMTAPLLHGAEWEPGRGYAPIANGGQLSMVIATAASQPFNDLGQFLAYVRQHPGSVSYASSGIGAMNHLAGEYIKQLAGIDMVHVPYKGEGAFAPDVIGKTTTIGIATNSTIPLILNGQLKALAVLTPSRLPSLPSVRTASEQGLAVAIPVWSALVGPPGMHPDLVARINRDMNDALATPSVRSVLDNIGLSAKAQSGTEFTAFTKDEYQRWSSLIRKAGIVLS